MLQLITLIVHEIAISIMIHNLSNLYKQLLICDYESHHSEYVVLILLAGKLSNVTHKLLAFGLLLECVVYFIPQCATQFTMSGSGT